MDSSNKKQPPSHVVKAAQSLAQRDVAATKVLYEKFYVAGLNDSSFINLDIEVPSFDVDYILDNTPVLPAAISSKKSLLPVHEEDDMDSMP